MLGDEKIKELLFLGLPGFGHLIIVIWDLFVIWCLEFGI
jgi:hypothetical protein